MGSTVSLIDSHAHLTYDALHSDIDGVLRGAAAAGAEHIILVGTQRDDWPRVLALCQRHSSVFAALGVHPHQAAEASDDDFAALRELRAAPGVVAAGEMGLDYHYDFSDRASQQ